MRTIICVALALGLAALVGVGQDDFPIFVYPCSEAAAPPNIDGALEDACWTDAPMVSEFTLYDKPVAVEVQTAFRVTYDSDFLYFGVLCADPLTDKVPRTRTARDNHQVFSGEAVEFFVDPKHDHTDYYQFAAGAGGGLWDSKRSSTVWNAAVQLATHIGDGQWSVELAIPWADLGVTPQDGAVVGFNVCRDRNIGESRTWSNWSQTQANFHDPVRFAHLVLSPTPEQLGKLAEEFREGDRSGPIRIFSVEGFARTSHRELAKGVLARIGDQLSELDRARAEEEDPAAQEELRKRIEAYREKLEIFRQQIERPEPIDAMAWAKIDWDLNALSGALGAVIWEARLSALLSSI